MPSLKKMRLNAGKCREMSGLAGEKNFRQLEEVAIKCATSSPFRYNSLWAPFSPTPDTVGAGPPHLPGSPVAANFIDIIGVPYR